MANNYNSSMTIASGSKKKTETENFHFVNVFVIIEVVH